MSIRLYTQMEQLGSHWMNIQKIFYLSILRKYVEKIQIHLKYDKNKGYFIWNCNSYLAQFFL
jgi:hypothetical protein